MTTVINYVNVFGDTITFDQAQLIDKYIKQIYIDGVHVKDELHTSEGLKGVYYFVDSLLEISNILNEDNNASFRYTYFQNGYKVVESLSYKESVLSYKVVTIYIGDNDICTAKYDVLLNVPINVEKFLYDSNNELQYTLTYDTSGNCVMIYDNQQDQADILPHTIGSPNQFFSWSGKEYYQYAMPIIPQK